MVLIIKKTHHVGFLKNILLLNILPACLCDEQAKEAVQQPLPRHSNKKSSNSQHGAVALTHHKCFCCIKKTIVTVFIVLLSGKGKLHFDAS